jgi:hypothetical protein
MKSKITLKCIDEKLLQSILLYIVSVLLVMATASVLAFNNITIAELLKINFGVLSLVGFYMALCWVIGRVEYVAPAVAISLASLPLHPYLVYVFWLVALLGIILLLRLIWVLSPKLQYSWCYILLLFPLLVLGTDAYTGFQYKEMLAAGEMHKDTLFHSAIAAMYKNYGVTSVGLDGLVPVQYHTLSHKIIAGISLVSGLSIIATYNQLVVSMGPALLVFGLVSMVRIINPNIVMKNALIGVLLLLLAIRVFPPFGWAALFQSHFVSESYLVALLLLISSISALLVWVQTGGKNTWLLVAAYASLILASMTKGSMAVVGIVPFYMAALYYLRNVKYISLLVLATLILAVMVIDSASGAQARSPVNPFHFLSYMSVPLLGNNVTAKLPFFLVVYFLFVWICFFFGIKISGRSYFKSMEFVVLFGLLVPGLVLSMLFEIGGGSAGYFSSIPVLMAIPFLVANHMTWIGQINPFYLLIVLLVSLPSSIRPLYKASFVKEYRAGSVRNPDVEHVLEQLYAMRKDTARLSVISITNRQELVSKIGCNVYWLLPAIAERPFVGALPDGVRCKRDSYYGLADYTSQHSEIPLGMNVTTVSIKFRADE